MKFFSSKISFFPDFFLLEICSFWPFWPFFHLFWPFFLHITPPGPLETSLGVSLSVRRCPDTWPGHSQQLGNTYKPRGCLGVKMPYLALKKIRENQIFKKKKKTPIFNFLSKILKKHPQIFQFFKILPYMAILRNERRDEKIRVLGGHFEAEKWFFGQFFSLQCGDGQKMT